MNNGGGGDGICGAGGVGYSVGADGDDGNGADYGGVDDVAVSGDVDGDIKSSSPTDNDRCGNERGGGDGDDDYDADECGHDDDGNEDEPSWEKAATNLTWFEKK